MKNRDKKDYKVNINYALLWLCLIIILMMFQTGCLMCDI